MSNDALAVNTENLTFEYNSSRKAGIEKIDLSMKPGEKFLLVGSNGAGKSTLLKILAGKKLIKSGKLELFGYNPFDLQNNYKLNSKNIIYLGTEWANNEITKRDIKVDELIESVGGSIFKERRDKLIKLLEINLNWHMNQCSDGERRRVQLCMGLLKPFDLLLLDEVTIDLDVLTRDKLFKFLSNECKENGSCIIYATHIFDGLSDNWSDLIIHLKNGKIVEKVVKDRIVFTSDADAADNRNGTKKDKIYLPFTKSLLPLALKWLSGDNK